MRTGSSLLLALVLTILGSGYANAATLQLDATSTSFFDSFTIVFVDTGDGLLQQEEIAYFSGVSGVSSGTPLTYTGVAYVPAIPGISTASGTINPDIPCAQCWELTPSNFGDASDGWFDTRWTYAVSAYAEPSQTMNFSYTFTGLVDPNPWTAGSVLSGQIQGTIMPDGDTVVIDSFGAVELRRPGIPDFSYASIDNSEFNSYPFGDVPVMSFSGLKNNFRSCPEGFIDPFNDCAFSTSPGGGFLITFTRVSSPNGFATAADGSGNTTLCNGDATAQGCRVRDTPVELANWSLAVEVPADDCTAIAGGCNPTGFHEIVLPENFVVPPGGTITQTATSFVDPRADASGRCDGQTPLVLFDGDLIIPPHICGSPEFEVLTTEANFEILEGTILNTVFPEEFVSNPFDCTLPIVGDQQLQGVFVWQPTDSADVIEGRALEQSFDCGSSRGRTRGFSFYLVGMHIDFGLDFDHDPEAVTQAFIDLTHTKFASLVQSVRNARPALRRRDYFRLFIKAYIARKLHKRGRFQAASRTLASFIRLTERARFDTSGGFNNEGNLLSRADNIKFTLDEKIIPFAGHRRRK